MTETLMHQQLKLEAKQILLSKGYEENKIIIDKKWIRVELNGQEFPFRVDVYASNGTEFAVECGNFPRWKYPFYEKYFGKENILHIPYPLIFGRYTKKEIEKDSLTPQQQKQFLIDTYKNQIYSAFKDDHIFDFQEFNDTTRDIFDIDNHRKYKEINPDYGSLKEAQGKTVWMNFPSSKTISKEEYKKEIHWGMIYYGKNVVAITIIFSGKEACKKFLSLSDSTHDKIFNALKKLPGFHIRDGNSFWKNSSRPPLDKEWNNPIPCDELSKEEYDGIRDNLDNLLRMQEMKFKIGPVLDLAKGFFEDYEVPEAISSLRELYSILLQPETKIDTIAAKIKEIRKWAWYIEQRKWTDLHTEYQSKFNETIDIKEFKRACNKLRYDPEYSEYVTGNTQ